MKRLVVVLITFGLVFGATVAFADEPICGDIDVNAIKLWESALGTDVPVDYCDVNFDILTSNQQTYTLNAKAFGTQLNLALLQAYHLQKNYAEPAVDACMDLNFTPDAAPGYTLYIRWVGFGM